MNDNEKTQRPRRVLLLAAIASVVALVLTIVFRSSPTERDEPVQTQAGGAPPNETPVVEASENAVREMLRAMYSGRDSAWDTGQPATPLHDIRVTFKLDPRITKSLFMGERWTSPQTFTQVGSQRGKEVNVGARAELVDARGTPQGIDCEWMPADPSMVTITPIQGRQATISVWKPGESTVQVMAQGTSKALNIKASLVNDVMKVEISPQPATRLALAEAGQPTVGK